MSGLFSDYREEVRCATRIADLLSSRGIIVGRHNKASCPFHADGASPNLHVYDDHVYCYACRVHADVFGIVEKLDHLSHREAVDRLARDTGIAPWNPTPEEAERARRADRSSAMLEAAAKFYAASLTDEHRDYLRARGVTDEQIVSVGFGSANGRLAAHLHGLGFEFGEMCTQPDAAKPEKWLAKRSESGVVADFFWSGLIVIPIRHRGRVVGFTARNLEGKPKFVHLPGKRTPFGLDSLHGDERAVVVEGPFDALSTDRHGYPAVALLGIGIDDALAALLKRFKKVYIALDADEAGRDSAVDVASAIGPRARIIMLPDGKDPDQVTKEEFDAALAAAQDIIGHKLMDLEPGLEPTEVASRIEDLGLIVHLASENDLRCDAHIEEIAAKLGFNKGKTKEFRSSVRKLITAARRAMPYRLEPPAAASGYTARDGALLLKKDTRDGPVEVQLANFDARIVGDLVENDGVESRRLYEITATVGERQTTFRVPASEFAGMNWVLQRLGPKAIVAAGMSSRDHARAAIQSLSGVPAERQVFTHTGWTEINGVPVFLHVGGAIGAQGALVDVEVRLDPPLDRFSLPAPAVESIATDVAASLGVLDVAPLTITTPQFAAIWRAIIGPNDLSLHVVGMTGVFKTELAALVQRHFGIGMDAERLPAAWSGTANSLEVIAFLAANTILVIDDFVPDSDPMRSHRDAARLFRAKGNCAGRSRLRQDATLQLAKPPRALILSTGEDTPRGHSLRARMVIVEVPKGAVDSKKLSACQRNAADGAFVRVTSAFIQWFAPRRADFLKGLEARVRDLRALSDGEEMHRKTPDAIANLMIGIDVFFEFAVAVNAISTDAANKRSEECRNALLQVAHSQSEHHAAADVVERFLTLLRASLTSGAAHLCNPDGGEPARSERWGWTLSPFAKPQGDQIGWVVDGWLYLEFQAAYRVVTRGASDSGDPFGVSSQVLKKRLAERGLIETEQRGLHRHLEVRRTLQGVRRAVVALRADAVFGSSEDVTSEGQAGQEGQVPPAQESSSRDPRDQSAAETMDPDDRNADVAADGSQVQESCPTCPTCPEPQAVPISGLEDPEGDRLERLAIQTADSVPQGAEAVPLPLAHVGGDITPPEARSPTHRGDGVVPVTPGESTAPAFGENTRREHERDFRADGLVVATPAEAIPAGHPDAVDHGPDAGPPTSTPTAPSPEIQSTETAHPREDDFEARRTSLKKRYIHLARNVPRLRDELMAGYPHVFVRVTGRPLQTAVQSDFDAFEAHLDRLANRGGGPENGS